MSSFRWREALMFLVVGAFSGHAFAQMNKSAPTTPRYWRDASCKSKRRKELSFACALPDMSFPIRNAKAQKLYPSGNA